jgi:DNA primase
VVPLRTRYRRAAYRRPLDVEAARAVPILDVARRLGWEVNPRRPYVLCPFHEDRAPSLHLNPKKNRAFCNPCCRSWDSIALYRDVRGLSFPDAVRELAA